MADKADSAMQYVNGFHCSAVLLIFKILDFIKQQVEACIPPAVATIPKEEDAVLSSEVVDDLTAKVLDHDGRPRLLPWVSAMESAQFVYEGAVGSLPLEQICKKVSESPELFWRESVTTSGVVNFGSSGARVFAYDFITFCGVTSSWIKPSLRARVFAYDFHMHITLQGPTGCRL